MKLFVKLLSISILFFGVGYSQSDKGLWDKIVKKAYEHYSLSIPSSWTDLNDDLMKLIPKDKKVPQNLLPKGPYFVGDGRGLPGIYNDSPVMLRVFLLDQEASNLDDAKEKTIEGYKQNPDRVFAQGFSHEEEDFTINSGEKAYLLNTRFFRKEQGLHQSRFDLVMYSEKAKTAYLYTLSVQYSDEEYHFESKYKLKEMARTLFSHFELK
jgi:hypothetical protein